MIKHEYGCHVELDDGYVKCPECGHDCTHIGKVTEDDESIYCNQGNVTINFEGECGHKWKLIYAGHKGYVSKGKLAIKQVLEPIKNNSEDADIRIYVDAKEEDNNA